MIFSYHRLVLLFVKRQSCVLPLWDGSSTFVVIALFESTTDPADQSAHNQPHDQQPPREVRLLLLGFELGIDGVLTGELVIHRRDFGGGIALTIYHHLIDRVALGGHHGIDYLALIGALIRHRAPFEVEYQLQPSQAIG